MKMDPVVHFEMPYEDGKRVAGFYSQAFGWGMKDTGEKMGNYILATTTETDEQGRTKKPGAINGGFFLKMAGVGTTIVISVDNLEEGMKKVAEAGGKTLGEIMDIPGIGRYVAFLDSEGNRVGMLQPAKM